MLRYSARDPAGHYERLGVRFASDAKTLNAAFRRKAKQLHPDVPQTGDKDAFIAVKNAYDVLSDPAKRDAYDSMALVGAAGLYQLRRRPSARPWELVAWAACAVGLLSGIIGGVDWGGAAPAPVSTPAVVSAPAAIPPEPAAPPSLAAQAAPAAAAPETDPALLDALMTRGRAVLAAGDISAARMLFERAARSGSAAAMIAAGQTFDPLVLGSLGVRGFLADPAGAARWYGQAAATGDADAAQRLERLRQARLL